MANTEEEITGVYPELPEEFAAEMEKFETDKDRDAQEQTFEFEG